jgi:Small-conductance mechanosensitive channel
MRRFFLLLLPLLWLAASATVTSAWGQATPPAATDWNAPLNAVSRQLRDPRISGDAFGKLRVELDRLRVAATAERDQFRQAAAAGQTQLDALGPAPTADQPRESAGVAESRRQLSAQQQRLQDGVKQAELALARILVLQDEVAQAEHQQFARQLTYRGQSPFSPSFWQNGVADIEAAADSVTEAPAIWWAADEGRRPAVATMLQMGMIAILAIVLLVPVQRWLRRRFGIDASIDAPSPVRRTIGAFVEWLNWTAMPLAVLWAVYGVLWGNGWVIELIGGFLTAFVQSASLALLALGLTHAALAPRNPAWALVPLPQPQRDRLLRRVTAFATGIIVIALASAPTRMPDFGSAGRDMAIAAIAAFLVLFNLAFADPRLWRPLAAGHRRLLPIALAVFALNLIAFGAILLGYYGFALFLAYGLLASVIAVAAYALVRIAARDALNQLAAAPEGQWTALRLGLGLSGPMSTTMQLLFGLLVDAVLLLLLLVALALAWGVSTSALVSYMLELFYGVTIGPVTISLGEILAAVVVMVIGIGLTRFFSNGLNARLEVQSGIDPGVRNSMVTGLTYAGYLLAVLAAVAALGLDLSNLAIIAGALSVGIGFGLQNIVNNFVSGLILLIERPVKVGDWVVIGDKEGYVRRINVRSTEIETFPRASVIIPNSALISSPVMNWTHRNRLGRVDINIGLSYAADVEKASAVLLDCLKQHPEILSMPAPAVVFRDFGAGMLTFALRGHIANVERRMAIESELRTAIHKACRENGVPLPYGSPAAPTVVQIKDLDRIEKLVKDILDAREPKKS